MKFRKTDAGNLTQHKTYRSNTNTNTNTHTHTHIISTTTTTTTDAPEKRFNVEES